MPSRRQTKVRVLANVAAHTSTESLLVILRTYRETVVRGSLDIVTARAEILLRRVVKLELARRGVA